MPTSKKSRDAAQSDRFKEAAKKIEADESGTRFSMAVEKILTVTKPKKPLPKK